MSSMILDKRTIVLTGQPLTGRDECLNPLEGCDIPLFHITTGSSTFYPAVLTKKTM